MGKYILNVDRDGEKCLLVRVPGQPSKLFRPRNFASPADMNQAAEAYAEMLLDSPVPLPLQRSAKVDSDSGIPGVRVKMVRGERHWLAEVTHRNKTNGKLFSVRKYGEAEAKRLAIKWREEHEEPEVQPNWVERFLAWFDGEE